MGPVPVFEKGRGRLLELFRDGHPLGIRLHDHPLPLLQEPDLVVEVPYHIRKLPFRPVVVLLLLLLLLLLSGVLAESGSRRPDLRRHLLLLVVVDTAEASGGGRQ